ncbi:hypothetical protein DPMN_013915 [Dreissena polymorpha]|uniref:Uncharacterized protein n=1 Tax=Dreissena polymorpha TaxID=45954 RepID=A0A9D4N6A7_DREPO|nr:hypothetical protein DPMN_013915 [Dreissena polymorpha]
MVLQVSTSMSCICFTLVLKRLILVLMPIGLDPLDVLQLKKGSSCFTVKDSDVCIRSSMLSTVLLR